MNMKLLYVVVLLALVGVTGAIANAMAGHFAVRPLTDALWSEFVARFQALFIVAVLVERSVETYLNITGQNGIPTAADGTPQPPDPMVRKRALTAALVVSVPIALCGLRLFETLVTPTAAADWPARVLWHGVDILVSAGLMAGGSDLFHQVARVLTTGLDRLKLSFTPAIQQGGAAGSPPPTPFAELASSRLAKRSLEIVIERPTGAQVTEGTLRVHHGGVRISAPCSWRVADALAAGVYEGCALTTLPASGRVAIQMPKASRLAGGTGALLMAAEDAAAQPGAIAMSGQAFDLLLECLTPRSASNIAVEVRDQ